MQKFAKICVQSLLISGFLMLISCSENNETSGSNIFVGGEDTKEETITYADINFSNWKVTLPVDINNNGSPEDDMYTYGFSSNNGPPLIKIYWKNGFIWSHKKSLADPTTDGDDLLDTSRNTWTDIKHNLGYVGFQPFHFRITASNARIEIQLNTDEPYLYEDISIDKWPFENYLNTKHSEAFSYIILQFKNQILNPFYALKKPSCIRPA